MVRTLAVGDCGRSGRRNALREDGDDIALGEVDRQSADVDVSRVFVLSVAQCIESGQAA